MKGEGDIGGERGRGAEGEGMGGSESTGDERRGEKRRGEERSNADGGWRGRKETIGGARTPTGDGRTKCSLERRGMHCLLC